VTTAIQVNITIMRAFAAFREMLATHEGLSAKLAGLEQRADGLKRGMVPETGLEPVLPCGKRILSTLEKGGESTFI